MTDIGAQRYAMSDRAALHREVIGELYGMNGYSTITLQSWDLRGRIPLIFIPDVAKRTGRKASDLSEFYNKPMITIGE